jgi:hypothetical protein
MIRRVLLGAGALALVAGTSLGVASGAASAGTPPTTFTGSITCAVTGVIHFKPALKNSGGSASTVTAKATLKSCTGDNVQSGITLKKGSLSITSAPATAANTCGLIMEGSPLPALTGEIKWSGHGGAIAPSAVSVAQPYEDYDSNTNSVNTNFNETTTTTGSFAAGTATFGGLGSSKSGYLLDSECGAPKGLSTVKFGKTQGTVTGTVTIEEAV